MDNQEVLEMSFLPKDEPEIVVRLVDAPVAESQGDVEDEFRTLSRGQGDCRN